MLRTVQGCAEALASGATTSRALVEDCLTAIADPAGEGARAFISVSAEAEEVEAANIDLGVGHVEQQHGDGGDAD
eukprot:gene37104-50057_t